MPSFKRKIKINKCNVAIAVGVLLLLIGISTALSFYIRKELVETTNDDLVEQYLEDTKDLQVKEENTEEKSNNKTSNSNKSTKSSTKLNYYAILSIPKANVNRGFFRIDSKYNDVNKNLEVVRGSMDDPLLVIIGHAGTGIHSYFKNLDKVKLKDSITIYYNGQKYIYKVTNIETYKKTGELVLPYPKKDSKMLVLATCNPKNRKTEQLVITAILDSVKNY